MDIVENRRCLRLRESEDVNGNETAANVEASTDLDVGLIAKVPIQNICRLEIGKSLSPVLSQGTLDHLPIIKCFSIIHKAENEQLSYLDFEASSVFEREAIVSTLMIVLDDHAQTPLQMRRRIIHQSSLHSLDESFAIPRPISLNQPELEQDTDVISTLSPMKRTRIHSDVVNDTFFSYKEEGTETSLVYFGDTSLAPSMPVDADLDPSIHITSHQRASDINDYDLEVAIKGPPQQQRQRSFSIPDDSGKTSAATIAPWCTDDICALALRDIAETCSGILDKNKDLPTPQPSRPDQQSDQREMVQSYIANVLGSPTDLMTFLSDGKVWNVNETTPIVEDRSKHGERTHINGRLRNRASLLNAQATRLRKLKSEMTFAAVLKSSRDKLHFVQTTQSLDDLDQVRNDRETSRKSRRRNQIVVTELATKFHSSALLQHIVDGMLEMTTPKANPLRSEFSEDDEVMYYDSDPEDARERNTSKGSRRAMAYRMNEEGTINEQDVSTSMESSDVDFGQVDFLLKGSKVEENLIIEIAEVCFTKSHNDQCITTTHNDFAACEK